MSQGGLDLKANFTPKNKTHGEYNPNNEMKSSLYMGNKRLPYKPTNFIGVITPRPDNMQPIRTFNPSGINGPYKPSIPIMRTTPIQPKFQ